MCTCFMFYKVSSLVMAINPMGGRPGLPGIAAANGGLSTWAFKSGNVNNLEI